MTTRILVAGAATLVVFVPFAFGGRTYTYPRFQPVSVAFVDAMHGVLAEDDWVCQKPHGCQGRLLVTSDGGAHWHLAYTGARGTHLYPVPDSEVVYAMTGDAMLESTDAGVHWRRLSWPPAVVSFVTALVGWKIGPNATMAHPPQLLATRNGGRSWRVRVNPCSGDYGLTAALSFASATRGWVVCNTQATSGSQGKEIWMTSDSGGRWKLEGRTHPIGPPEPKQQVGNLPGYGYPTGASFLADGHGWLLQGRGYMLVTTDAAAITVRGLAMARASHGQRRLLERITIAVSSWHVRNASFLDRKSVV